MAADTAWPAHRAGGASVIAALDAEWSRLAESPQLCRRLQQWAGEDPALAFVDGHELVAATAPRSADQEQTCAVLDGLVGRVPGDRLALRVALQVLLPRCCALIGKIAGVGLEERAALVIDAAVDQLVSCDPDAAGTPIDCRLWCNIRRKVFRAVERDRGRPEQPTVEDELERQADPVGLHEQRCVTGQLEPLVEWVADRGDLPKATAWMVVATRVAGAEPEAFADRGVQRKSVLRRRQRAEKRLRRRLKPAAA